jgi:16S rRNA G966 N2-methylase RsmD
MTQLEFVQTHLDAADLSRLLLSAHRYPTVDVPAAVAQIEALRKVRDKVPDWYDPAFQMPPKLSVEQASSAVAAAYKTSLLQGKTLVDLTGGMGVDSYYWSKVFDTVHYVEQQSELVAAARHNFERLGAKHIQCHHADSQEWLTQRPDARFDAIYLDPARRDNLQRKIAQLTDCQPNIIALLPRLWQYTDTVLLKTAPLLDIEMAITELGSVVQVWVVAVQNEVKEVLYLLQPEGAADPVIKAVNLGTRDQEFQRTQKNERTTDVPYGPPAVYLYEPNAAVLKAGAFRTFGAQYGLTKLHAHTHVYTSEALVPDVPGRTFKIVAICKYQKQAVAAWVPDGAANVTTRNFPDPVASVRKKLALRDGGNAYLFAVTLQDGQLAIIVTEKIEA